MPQLHSDTPVQPLDIFQSDALLRTCRANCNASNQNHPTGSNFISSARIKSVTLLPILAWLTGVAIAWRSGVLSQANLGDAWCHDIATLFPRQPTWSCLARQEHNAGQVSFLRDIPSQIMLIVAASTPNLIRKQWQGIYCLWPRMQENRVLRFDTDQNLISFNEDLVRTNNWFVRVQGAAPYLGLVSALMAAAILLATYHGVFPAIDGSRAKIYSAWWASIDHPASWLYYCSMLSLGIYCIFLMNLAGSRVVVHLWRIRKFITVDTAEYDPDGSYGWADARQILSASYVATTLYGITLAAMTVLLPSSSLPVLTIFFAQWLIVLPFYLYVPIHQIRSSILSYKNREMESTRQQLAELKEDLSRDSLALRRELAERLETLRRIRSLPFRGFRNVSIAVGTLMATVASIYSVLGAWFGFQ